MPKPKIASKTKAANRAAKQLGYKSAHECHNSGTPEHKRIVQDAFTNTSPR
ncbi:TPA: hypothetical protein ACPVZG_004146 [Vibrio parahaemolyticus]|uniref:hypothetical protein n=1 Tax=Vibrio parahaemolyticus TaxID=670 RepID=UPI0032AFD120